MNATTARGATAEQYLDRVRAALADLPIDEREELLEDLPAHLADVAAESDGALEERLGSPEEYAAELRASAGLAPPTAGAGNGVRGTRRLAEFSAAVDQWPAWQRFRAFAPSLRPGWWVLRGYLVALALAAGTTDMGHYGVSVEPDGDLFLFLPFAALVIWASVWLGRQSSGWRGGRRAAMYALNGAVVVVALALATVAASPRIDEATALLQPRPRRRAAQRAGGRLRLRPQRAAPARRAALRRVRQPDPAARSAAGPGTRGWLGRGDQRVPARHVRHRSAGRGILAGQRAAAERPAAAAPPAGRRLAGTFSRAVAVTQCDPIREPVAKPDPLSPRAEQNPIALSTCTIADSACDL